MKFCAYCGKKMEDEETCSCAEAVAAEQKKEAEKGQTGQPAVVQVDEIKKTLRAFFSKEPLKAMEEGKNSQSHIWMVFTAAFCLLYGLFFLAIITNSIASIPLLSGSIGAADKAKLFFMGFFLGLLLWGVAVLCVKGFLLIGKIELSLVKWMNLAAASFIPYGTALLVGILLSFIYAWGALILVILGALAGNLLLFRALENLPKTSLPVFWYFLGIKLVEGIVLSVFCNKMISGLLSLASFF